MTQTEQTEQAEQADLKKVTKRDLANELERVETERADLAEQVRELRETVEVLTVRANAADTVEAQTRGAVPTPVSDDGAPVPMSGPELLDSMGERMATKDADGSNAKERSTGGEHMNFAWDVRRRERARARRAERLRRRAIG